MTRLNVITEPKKPNRREAAITKFDQLWAEDPAQFDPNKNIRERTRVARIWDVLQRDTHLSGKKAADLGSGWGELSKQMAAAGADVDAVDIAKQALAKVEGIQKIRPMQEYVPRTKLDDMCYDVVLAAELIAYLPPDEYRLFMSEMCRLVKRDGFVICSTAIDINSEDALLRFAELFETEFQPIKWVVSYDRLWIRLRDFLEAPRRFTKASEDDNYRQRELQNRQSLGRWWFSLNSHKAVAWLWKIVGLASKPVANAFSNSPWMLVQLEKLCKTFWDDQGISHAIVIGKRWPLARTPEKDIPVVRPGKRQVWE